MAKVRTRGVGKRDGTFWAEAITSEKTRKNGRTWYFLRKLCSFQCPNYRVPLGWQARQSYRRRTGQLVNEFTSHEKECELYLVGPGEHEHVSPSIWWLCRTYTVGTWQEAATSIQRIMARSSTKRLWM